MGGMTEVSPPPTPEVASNKLASWFDPILAALAADRTAHDSWMRLLQDGEHLFLSIQVDRKATDPYSGGGFRIEIERTRSPRPLEGLNGRAMFFQLLNASEIDQLVEQQNRVIESLPKPPSDQIDLYPAGPVREMYLSYFETVDGFDPVRSWLRYRSVDHLQAWAETLIPLLGPMLDRAAVVMSTEVRHLGKGCLIES